MSNTLEPADSEMMVPSVRGGIKNDKDDDEEMLDYSSSSSLGDGTLMNTTHFHVPYPSALPTMPRGTAQASKYVRACVTSDSCLQIRLL